MPQGEGGEGRMDFHSSYMFFHYLILLSNLLYFCSLKVIKWLILSMITFIRYGM